MRRWDSIARGARWPVWERDSCRGFGVVAHGAGAPARREPLPGGRPRRGRAGPDS